MCLFASRWRLAACFKLSNACNSFGALLRHCFTDEITTKDPAPYHVQHLHDLQLVLERFEKVLAPLCEDMTNFDDDQSQLSCFFKAQLLPYRKTRDELKRTYDAIKSFQHRRSSLVEVYREAKETQTNKVLYLLTTVTTIFIPAQFLTGQYAHASPLANTPYLGFHSGEKNLAALAGHPADEAAEAAEAKPTTQPRTSFAFGHSFDGNNAWPAQTC